MKQKVCKCGCGQICAGTWKRGHHMRKLGPAERSAMMAEVGSKGGQARARRLSKARLRVIARSGGLARQGKHATA